MFGNLIRALGSPDGHQVSVSVPAGADGFFDRTCLSEACLLKFKIHEDDWYDKVGGEKVFCRSVVTVRF